MQLYGPYLQFDQSRSLRSVAPLGGLKDLIESRHNCAASLRFPRFSWQPKTLTSHWS
ncbi:hypothetical protein M8C21_028948 [Ambrosia artemisiifolia]|uniref:Uncharacterized protein n=1 Tax=Ambrosia artemisiifolia TaxID=4212 RepID=A0AAD5GPG1_AMBAR|nr:hypothetical protein M8C21_028948 [Ambrosia artemisiifolia]